jgi:hypothetical protein
MFAEFVNVHREVPMEPSTLISTGVVVGVAAKQAQDFIAAVCGHPGESLGTILGKLGKRRMQNAEAVGIKSHLILLNIGVQPQEVPLNILQPILEGASLQEDSTLQDTWANLLANAADPRNQNPVMPSFHAMLKELTSREVLFLEAIYAILFQPPIPLKIAAQMIQKIYIEKLGYDQKGLALSLGVLMRNQVLTHDVVPRPLRLGDSLLRLPKGTLPKTIRVETEPFFGVTALGIAFISACRPPSPIASKPAGL